jgi:hypothetical protein
MNIAQKLSMIQEGIKVSKKHKNTFGNYNYRSAEDILEALKPMNTKYGVLFTIDEEVSILLDLIILKSMATIICSETNEKISVSSTVGVDLNQKGMSKPQQFGSASSYAKKYALGNLLLIDDTADDDMTNTHNKEFKPIVKHEDPKPLVRNPITDEQAKSYMEEIKHYKSKIEDAKTYEELAFIAEGFKDKNENIRNALRSVYSEKRNKLKSISEIMEG